MKVLSGAGVLGLLIGLAVIYWLSLEDTGAVTLTLLITVSSALAIGSMLSRRGRSTSATEDTDAH